MVGASSSNAGQYIGACILREVTISRGGVGLIKFNYDVPLGQTMAFDVVYPEALQLDFSQKMKYWEKPRSIFAWMLADGELAGESYGFPVASSDERINGLVDLTDSEKKSGIYCYSTTILPSFQAHGLGTILKAHWLGLAAGKGFDVIYGHARPGPSQKLNTKFGALFLKSFPDWVGTGEEYRGYRLALK
jgi:GNAT superfamily N-acetyltransferase